MERFLFALVLSLTAICPYSQTASAGEQAQLLRSQNDLNEFTPPQTFLMGDFVADEVQPRFVFGKVKDFADTRACPTAWLIETAEKKRLEAASGSNVPLEYSLTLEEDCPGKVIHYVFVDRSKADAAQWLEWRRLFHKNKTEGQYANAKEKLDKAGQKGFAVVAELRFIQSGGELLLQKPEDYLIKEEKVTPLYDVSQGEAPAK